ncbi:MAG: four helix bundle protein [Candidatus Omnitrophota bacterium]
MGGSWKDLDVWRESHSLVLQLYKLVSTFPATERYALVDQIKRAAYSIPANIVEGHSRNSKKEFQRYLYISRGSLEELRYFLLLAKDLHYIDDVIHKEYEDKLSRVSKMLNGLIRSLTY